MSDACIKNKQARVGSSLILGFLLVKKSTYAISQVAKFIKFGKNTEMILSEKVKDAFEKSQFYQVINTLIGTFIFN
jgi:hypothetical protein